MSSNITQIYNTWYAVLNVPEDVQDKLGKSKLKKTLQTSDKRVAVERSRLVIAEWKALIADARGSLDSYSREAILINKSYREAVKESDGDAQEAISSIIQDRAEQLNATKGYEAASEFASIASSHKTLIEPLIDDWLQSPAIKKLAPKTIKTYEVESRRLAKKFKHVESLSKRAILIWKTNLTETIKEATIKKAFTAYNALWKFLQSREYVDIERESPFKGIEFSIDPESYDPFTPEEVVRLIKQSQAEGKEDLTAFLLLVSYTGTRRGEVAELRCSDITENNTIRIKDAKTKAGLREIPIHSKIIELVNQLKLKSKDGYLVPCDAKGRGQSFYKKYLSTFNNTGVDTEDRKLSIHSLRKTVVTILENAGVSENVTADIVGHKKPRITYGLYSGGATLDVKKEAIEKLSYPDLF